MAFRAGASDRKTIVQRALSRVGEKGYNVCQQLSATDGSPPVYEAFISRPVYGACSISTSPPVYAADVEHALSALAASVFDVPVICLLSMPTVMHYEHIAHEIDMRQGRTSTIST